MKIDEEENSNTETYEKTSESAHDKNAAQQNASLEGASYHGAHRIFFPA